MPFGSLSNLAAYLMELEKDGVEKVIQTSPFFRSQPFRLTQAHEGGRDCTDLLKNY